MMQSILLTTPSKAPIGEKSSEANVIEETGSVEAKDNQEKGALDFSKMLGDLIEGEQKSTEAAPEEVLLELEAPLAEEELATDEVLPLGKELLGEEALDSTEPLPEEKLSLDKAPVDPALIDTNDKQVDTDADKLATDKALTSDLNKEAKGTATDEELDSVKAEPIEQDKSVNPLLAQIESAQKADTKVNEVNAKVSLQEGGIGIKDSAKSDKETLKSSPKLGKESFENVLSDDNEALPLKTKETAFDKLDASLASLKGDVNKPIFNQSNEANAFQPLGSLGATADKQLHQTSAASTPALLQSAALQQPLELQAKHGSAMVGERILMMLNQGKQEVTIRLDPAELGSMHIKLQVQQDQLQVTIQTQVGQSRDLIEQNLPRLREQLAQQGINLGETSVEQDSRQNQSNSQDSQAGNINAQGRGQADDGSIDEQSEWLTTQIPLPAQGIDYYA